MLRPLPVVALAIVALAAAASGCGGGGDGETEPAESPAPTPQGFVTQKGVDWSFARPADWQPAKTSADRKAELVVFQSEAGTAGLPSQTGIGVQSEFKDDLATAVRVARDLNETRFRNYEISKQERVKVAGGEAYRIDATYDSFTEDPVKIRVVDLFVQTPDRRQMNLFVRGPEADYERLGLDRILGSFRVL